MNMWSTLDIGLTQGLLFSCAVLGFGVALRILRFPDLTIEGSYLIGGGCFAAARIANTNFVAACVLGIIAGAFSGAVTAVLYSRFRINKFLSGILVVAALYSLVLRVMNGSNTSLLSLDSPFDYLTGLNRLGPLNTHFGDIAVLLLLVMTISIGMGLFMRSRTGMNFRAVGCNPAHARALGVPVTLYLTLGLAMTNALAALSGILTSTYQGFADAGMGQGTLIVSLASIALGERFSSSRHMPEYLSVIVASCGGSILYQLVIAVAVHLGMAPTDLKLVTSILVLVVIATKISKTEDSLVEAE